MSHVNISLITKWERAKCFHHRAHREHRENLKKISVDTVFSVVKFL